MQIGLLGGVIFEVSDETVKTLNNMVWSGSANYTTHKRHLNNSKTEFVGNNPDQIKFDILVSAYLGVNPQAVISQLFTYMRTATTLPFVLGSKAYGKYRWTIQQLQIKAKYYDREGDMTQATLSVSLLEYLKQ